MRPPLWIQIRTQGQGRSFNLWLPMPLLYLLALPFLLLAMVLALPFLVIGMVVVNQKTRECLRMFWGAIALFFETPGLEVHTDSPKEKVHIKVL